MDYREYFKGKKITVMGLGLLGRGVGDARFLAECGANIIVTDVKKESELKKSIDQLGGLKNIQFILGGHRMEDFQNRDIIIRGTGIPLDSSFIAEAKRNKIPVHNSTALFAHLSGCVIVGITGTRGKSTVTHMVYEVLQQVHKSGSSKVYLGGNVRGLSTLALLKEVKEGDVVVLELDSWQLQGFGEESLSPHVAVFTTFFDDHLNYYQGNRDLYLHDKAQIFIYQTTEDFLILGEQVENIVKEKYSSETKGKIIIAKSSSLPADLKLQIPGEHNRYNASCAYEALKAIGVQTSEIKKGLEEFKGVPGRLQFVKEANGIKIYNDTTATTPDATIAALKALGKDRNIVLVMGGADKGLDMSALKKAIPHYTKSVILLPGTGTDKLELSGALKAENLHDAVWTAFDRAEPDDILLFSPAFASFGLFRNEFDRGDKFLEEIKKL